MRPHAGLLLLAVLALGCRGTIAVHYLPDKKTNEYRAACRVWSTTILMKGETVMACVVPLQDDKQIPTGLTLGEDVATASATGWEATSKGTDDLDGSADLGHTGNHATTSAGKVELPLVGSSGIVLAQRDDDIGVETASIARWFMGIWGFVTIGLEAISDGLQ